MMYPDSAPSPVSTISLANEAMPDCEIDLNQIIVVDDTPANLFLIKAIFKRTEFSVLTAVDGHEALALAREKRPFLVLSDINMPMMSGLELCSQIKKDTTLADISVILVTAHTELSDRVTEGLDLGADDFIFRPFANDELVARVRAVKRLKKAELEAQYQAQEAQKKSSSLTLLNELAVTITGTFDLQDILASSLPRLGQLLNAEAVSVIFLEESSDQVTVNITSDTGDFMSFSAPFEPDFDMMALAFQEQVPAIIAAILQAPDISVGLSNDIDQQAIICVPMTSKGQVIGAVAIINRRDGDFVTDDWQLLDSAVSIVTTAVENARLFNEVQHFNQSLELKVQERTKQLEEEKEKVEAILTSMADGVLVLDADNRIETANTAAQTLLNLHLPELVGQSIQSETRDSTIWQLVQRLANHDDCQAAESIDIEHGDSEEIQSLQGRSTKLNRNSNHTDGSGTVIVLNDVTDITAIERMKARFMSGVTHELKTPLSVIRLHTTNLTKYRAKLPEHKQAQLLQAIQDQTALLGQLVEHILELSHLDANSGHTTLEGIDLVTLTDQLITEMKPLADEKQLTLRWEKYLPTLKIQANSDQISRVISNLVSNAIKYTPSQGEVDVQIQTIPIADKNVAKLSIKDTGIGIPLEAQAKIFERFYRVDASHTIPGTGLGLSIVKEIVKAHGGSVQLQSDGQQGSTFEVLLPCDGVPIQVNNPTQMVM
ncbi:MAG: ATP-binding protein [Chloroflexota bacterium]